MIRYLSTPRSGPSKTKFPEEQGKNDGPMLDMPLLSQPHHHLNALDTRHLVYIATEQGRHHDRP
jgi:hypothetical protein